MSDRWCYILLAKLRISLSGFHTASKSRHSNSLSVTKPGGYYAVFCERGDVISLTRWFCTHISSWWNKKETLQDPFSILSSNKSKKRERRWDKNIKKVREEKSKQFYTLQSPIIFWNRSFAYMSSAVEAGGLLFMGRQFSNARKMMLYALFNIATPQPLSLGSPVPPFSLQMPALVFLICFEFHIAQVFPIYSSRLMSGVVSFFDKEGFVLAQR